MHQKRETFVAERGHIFKY